MHSQKRPAVIVGFERNGLGVSRALAAHGIPCIGVGGPRRLPEWRTRTCTVRSSREWSEEGLLEEMHRIASEFREPLPVMITKDQAVLWLSRARDSLKDSFLLELPTPDVVELLMSKRAFDERARNLGLPMPKTWHIETDADLRRVAREISFPAILKPQVKNDAFRRQGGPKAYHLDNMSELEAAYRQVAQWEPEVIVQEWVHGPDANVAFCLSYVGRAVRAFFAGRKLLQYPIRCGNTAICEPAPEGWKKELVELTEKVWSAVNYTGIGSVEYKFDSRRQRFFVMEPTVGRTNYQNEIAVINGVNIPAIAYFSALDEPARALDVLEGGRATSRLKLIDSGAALRSALDSRPVREISLAQGLRMFSGQKRWMLFRPSDPMPFLALLSSWIVGRCQGAFRRIRRMVTARQLSRRAVRPAESLD